MSRPEAQFELDLGATPSPPAAVRAPASSPDRLPDQDARDVIRNRLDTNVLVEAGAGAGKTHEMVGRMVALVEAGKSIEQIAAVTFTRKAAAELRERFQTDIEKAIRSARDDGDAARARVLDDALRLIDRATIGTIHSFCARMLRERPLEARVDPGFREVMEADAARLTRAFWRTWVERTAAAGDVRLAQLRDVGVSPDELFNLFETLVENPDVEFPAPPAPRPESGPVRAELEALLDDALAAMPSREPDKGWDRLQQKVQALKYARDAGWSDDLRFLDAVVSFCGSDPGVVQNRWPSSSVAKGLQERARAFRNGAGEDFLKAWREHRYPLLLDYTRDAAKEFEATRRRDGTLFFQDLLLLAARLLRERPVARRELGERYRYILVDEFQDTDPIQAEVLLLLASATGDWQDAVPRPGALFVVGDPKQSIYRFRRADISIYNQVKRRFREFGMVVELTANFRSTKPIENLVNAAFERLFPKEATEHQAAFAPLNTRRSDERSAVRKYFLQGPTQAEMQRDESKQLAEWIRQRVDSGDARAGDFLILVSRNKELAPFASAIEAVDLPVDVTGSGISIEDEVKELRLLLRALSDPGDPVLTVAVLVGRFYGLDFEQLAAYVLDQNQRIRMLPVAPPEATGPVADALRDLHALWELSRRQPADILVDHICDRFGLLPYAAAGELGGSRAGALLFVTEAVRSAALAGDASLRGALDAIEATLEAKEAEAPLEPGRSDAVRVMNLHQAKGLEGEIVILAAPRGKNIWPPSRHIARRSSGPAEGFVRIVRRAEKGGSDLILAEPPGWELYDMAERQYEGAEDLRELYVAATRAKRELVVGCCSTQKSPWKELEPFLREAEIVDLPASTQRVSLPPPTTPEEIAEAIARIEAERAARAAPGYHAAPVTDRVKPKALEVVPAFTGEYIRGRGPDWGRALHGALEAAMRGVRGERLRRVVRDLLIASERPTDADGEPEELDEAIGVIEGVQRSELWTRAREASNRLAEVPFALALEASEYAAIEAAARGVPVSEVNISAPLQLIEGVIDLVFRDGDGWTIVDYKTDAGGLGVEEERLVKYRAQVGLYAEAWHRLTGEPVHERAILFTATGEVERW